MRFDSLMIHALRELCWGEPNVKRIAEKVGVPRTTLYSRVRALRKEGKIRACPNYFALDLQPVVVFAKTPPSNLILPYLISIVGIEGAVGYYSLALYAFPNVFLSKYTGILKEKGGVLEVSRAYNPVYWIPEPDVLIPSYGGLGFNWREFDSKLDYWELRENLLRIQPPSRLDETDAFIVKELEKDIFTPIKKIAELLKIHPNLALYHYRRHVRTLITRNIVELKLNYKALPKLFVFYVRDKGSLSKITSALARLPFTLFIYPLLDKFKVYGALALSQSEERRMFRSLRLLAGGGFLEKVEGVGFLDSDSRRVHCIPHLLFKGESWIFSTEISIGIGEPILD